MPFLIVSLKRCTIDCMRYMEVSGSAAHSSDDVLAGVLGVVGVLQDQFAQGELAPGLHDWDLVAAGTKSQMALDGLRCKATSFNTGCANTGKTPPAWAAARHTAFSGMSCK